MKRNVLLMLIAITMLLLIACGNDKETETGGDANTDNSKSEGTAKEGDEKPLDLRVGVVVGDWSPHYKAAQSWSDSLNEKTDGKIKLTVYPDGQLGGEREMLEAVQKGSLDIGLISSAVYSIFEPKMSILDVPFLVSSFDDAEKLMDGKAGDELSALMLEKGIRNLAWGHNDFRIITNNKKEIKEPGDLAKVKMRVPESKVLSDWYVDMKAMATPMPFPDIYTALQQGVVDGQDNGPILTFAAKFYEHQDYITVSNHQYSPIGFFISEKIWKELTDEQKSILEETAKEASKVERNAIREFNEKSISSMEEAAVQVYRPTGEELEKFKESTAPFIDQIRSVSGKELTELVLDEAGYSN